MSKIKKLTTNGVSGIKIHEVGKDNVTDISDFGIDAEQNYVCAYGVDVNGKLKHRYENGVYEVEYFD